MSSVELSIIIVSWNAKEFLIKCIKSLLPEIKDYVFEIIVVDNASSDGSAGAVAEHFPEIKVIKNPVNLGFAKANNLGIELSQGRYLCFINSDVVLLNGCIEGLIRHMESHSGSGIIGPKLLNSDLSYQSSCKKFPSLWIEFCGAFGFHRILGNWFSTFRDDIFVDNDNPRKVDVIAGTFWMVRRTAIEIVGALDEDYFFYREDYDWCKRFWKNGWDVVVLPRYQVIHYGGASSSYEASRFKRELYRSKLTYWIKNHSFLSQVCLIIIVISGQIVRLWFTVVSGIFRLSYKTKAFVIASEHLRNTCWIIKYSVSRMYSQMRQNGKT